MSLTKEQLERYNKNILLKEVGYKGQEKISNAKIIVIGAGGLGSSVLFYLAAAGIGTIGIVDDDIVSLSNLQRQILHFTSDIGKPKVLSGKEKIEKLNPNITVIPYNTKINANNIIKIIKDYDFVIDATDNFPAKFLINDACVSELKPFSHGGVLMFKGQTMTYIPNKNCYRCIFEKIPPDDLIPKNNEIGILGSIPGILGSIQASEALKYVLGINDLLVNKLLTFDAITMNFRTIEFNKNNNCPICKIHY